MRIQIAVFLKIFFLLFTLAACSKEGSVSDNFAADISGELEGSWQGSCLPNKQSSQDTMIFSGNTMSSTHTIYSRDCVEALYRINILATINYGKPATSPVGAKFIDSIVTKFEITPLSNEGIYHLRSKACGNSFTWNVNESKECTEMKEGKSYTIYSLNEEKLQLGIMTDSHSGNSPNTRPIEMSSIDEALARAAFLP